MTSTVNRYAADCFECGGPVAAKAGTLTKAGRAWRVRHLACDTGPGVSVIRFSSGATEIRNRNGRCEDAPCCGCCTI